jgi:FkbM family methyltransferase
MKRILKGALRKLGIAFIRQKELDRLRKNSAAQDNLNFLLAMNGGYAEILLQSFRDSKSQLKQDLFVLSQLSFKRGGYFVEFGATNGIDLSNTHLMEKNFGWTGILAEPAICWQNNLKNNRACHIETSCVWRVSNSTLTFNETQDAELSTLSEFTDSDLHEKSRMNGKSYTVKTISLNDLLAKYNAPSKIDYLSIDTEGSEYEILSNFDFSKYSFEVITCEHNYTPMRDKIYSLLTSHGYKRVREDLSDFDDWYIKSA